MYTTTYATGIDTLLPSATPYTTLFQQNKLPQTALFSSTAPTTGGSVPALDALFPTITPPTTPAAEAPLFALGFSANNYLINNSYRLAYIIDAATNPDGAVPTFTTPTGGTAGGTAVAPANGLRQAFKINDLRGFIPAAPVLLCGGHSDPTVYYSVNTGTIATLLTANPYVSAIDVDTTSTSTHYGAALSAPLAALQTALQTQFDTTAAGVSTAAGGGVAGATAVTTAYHGTLVPPFCTKAAQQFFKSIYP